MTQMGQSHMDASLARGETTSTRYNRASRGTGWRRREGTQRGGGEQVMTARQVAECGWRVPDFPVDGTRGAAFIAQVHENLAAVQEGRFASA